MNKDTIQQLLDDLVRDITDVLKSEHKLQPLIWWRGRLSGVRDTIHAMDDSLDFTLIDKALEALYEAENESA